MSNKDLEIDELVKKLYDKGMDISLARRNLMECDRYFIERLNNIL